MRIVRQFGVVAIGCSVWVGSFVGCADQQERLGGTETEPDTPTAPPGVQPPDATETESDEGQGSTDPVSMPTEGLAGTSGRYDSDSNAPSDRYAGEQLLGGAPVHEGSAADDSLLEWPQSSGPESSSRGDGETSLASPSSGVDHELSEGFDPQLVGERYGRVTATPSDSSSAE